ncbi:thioesterase family protein [Pseudarthrobacter sp. J64]|uniref:thioesterase family protein n=1 Tax=Pseudarthrobacter sp. J64 TaxID=3116485 RepID=UPI002E8134B0|nr:thioesterase family protein [Pseudarthrobacter sp. J64]MEE2570006.1 thioesterase family protein [Pseudarthrobacter sp. J64]
MTDVATGTLPEYRCTVRPEWIDYNGHMSEAFYVLVFGFATDQVMEVLGMDKRYRQETGSSLYTVEAHIRYLMETALDAELTVTTVIAGGGPKKLHLAHELHVGGQLAATEEILALHVNTLTGRTEAFPQAVSDNIATVWAASGHRTPEWAGRKVTA